MNLFDDINVLKLTSKQREVMQKLNIMTVNDLLVKYPKRYQVIEESFNKDKICVEVEIISLATINFFNGRKNRISFRVKYQNKEIDIVIFNRYYLFNNLRKYLNKIVTINGYYQNNNIIVNEVYFKPIKNVLGITPIYTLNGYYDQKNYYKLVSNTLSAYIDIFEDCLPTYLMSKYQLMTKKEAIKTIHKPLSIAKLNEAKRTLIYEELFLFSLSVISKRNYLHAQEYVKEIDWQRINTFNNTLPYQLTDEQNKVIKEIYHDLVSDQLMNRILIADVGSGKTIIGLISALMVIEAGYQVAFMAPTTILAQQHFQSAIAIFKNDIKIALLTSNISENEKKVLLDKLSNHEIDLIIGTHALYQKDVIFDNLGLVIYDEQQKFGVNQRIKLIQKGVNVECLMLSATPIPRTLTQVIFANIDVSYLFNNLPHKQIIKSFYYQSKSVKPFYNKMIELLELNQQIYIITPLVEESLVLDIKNAINIHRNITKYFNNRYKVGLIHGKMNNNDKEIVMNEFINHHYDILVSTSLLEVGISVANATCIIIYDAHRFGLSQLHQLRGRVGRSSLQGYCVFLSPSSDENVIERLEYITNNDNGFKIAEYDMMNRGSGDILGVKQAGLPNFKIASLSENNDILKIAFKDAQDYFNTNNS
ncbi:MAG: ATP-dependent DNA helicase RecG [Bacilli bacterium]|jgi:ATP-dependent DNA helicase RecG|nr:ATP-dependent DNA helicase RecG [Bacilli bacterium]